MYRAKRVNNILNTICRELVGMKIVVREKSLIKNFKCSNFKNFKSPKKAFNCLSINNYYAITLYFNYIHKSTLSKLSYCEKNPS